jgi:AraC-like DNA-binding protein
MSVVLTTLKILGGVLYAALALAFRAGRVFSRPLRWFLLCQGLAVLRFSTDPSQAEGLRSSQPWLYVLFVLPVLALFPLLYLAAREGRAAGAESRTAVPRAVFDTALSLLAALGLVALTAGAALPAAGKQLLPGPGAPPATSLLWNGWHLAFICGAVVLTRRGGGSPAKGQGVERRLLRLLVWYGTFIFAVSGALEFLLPRLDLPVTSLLMVLLSYGFLALLLARAPALLWLARSRYAGSDLDAHSAARLAEKARARVDSGRLWADPRMSLQVLAERCASRPRDLSQAINQTYGIGFPGWINGFRLDEARRLLASGDRRVADIAYDVGFNSLSSFNAAFKDRTGLTPTAWRKKLTDS